MSSSTIGSVRWRSVIGSQTSVIFNIFPWGETRLTSLCFRLWILNILQAKCQIYNQVGGRNLAGDPRPSLHDGPTAAFSSMDLPQDYQYRREAAAASEKAVVTPHNIIGRMRQRRSHHAICVTFDVEQIRLRFRIHQVWRTGFQNWTAGGS